MHSKDAKCDFAAQGPVTFTGSTDPTRLNCSRAASIQSGRITRRAPYRNYVHSHDNIMTKKFIHNAKQSYT